MVHCELAKVPYMQLMRDRGWIKYQGTEHAMRTRARSWLFASLTGGASFLSMSALRRPMADKLSKLYLSVRIIWSVQSTEEISVPFNSTGCVCAWCIFIQPLLYLAA